MYTDVLKQLGLTNTEVKIYLALFELGPSLASGIADKTKVNRAVTYHVLENLIKKGIVGYVIKENRKYFSAAAPKKLLDLLKVKEEAVKEIIPELDKLRRPLTEKPVVEVYQGVEGLKTVLNDILDEGTDYFVIGYTGAATRLAKFWFSHWQTRRAKMKIKRFVLFPNKMKDHEATKYPLTAARFLPPHYETPTSTFIYGNDKVLIFLPVEDDFTGISIQSKGVWKSFKNTFEFLWKISK